MKSYNISTSFNLEEVLTSKTLDHKKSISATDLTVKTRRLGSSISFAKDKQSMMEAAMLQQARTLAIEKEIAMLRESYAKFEIKSNYNQVRPTHTDE